MEKQLTVPRHKAHWQKVASLDVSNQISQLYGIYGGLVQYMDSQMDVGCFLFTKSVRCIHRSYYGIYIR